MEIDNVKEFLEGNKSIDDIRVVKELAKDSLVEDTVEDIERFDYRVVSVDKNFGLEPDMASKNVRQYVNFTGTHNKLNKTNIEVSAEPLDQKQGKLKSLELILHEFYTEGNPTNNTAYVDWYIKSPAGDVLMEPSDEIDMVLGRSIVNLLDDLEMRVKQELNSAEQDKALI